MGRASDGTGGDGEAGGDPRAARLSAALRENLRRRKRQARARDGAAAPAEAPGDPSGSAAKADGTESGGES